MQATLPTTEYDIRMDRVSKEFDKQTVVENASLDVQRGEIFGFVGPSGSGKTTTVRMMTGVYAPTSGQISVLGQEPAHFSRHNRESFGYLPQQFVLYPNLSVMENMRFAASLYGLGYRERGPKIQRALEFVELWDVRGRLADQLSGGMRRRLGLAAATVHEPRLVFADEPTAGIDPVLRERFWEGFKELRERGRTLFVTTQYVTEAEYCDHVALMAEGKIVANDTPEGLRRKSLGGEAIDVEYTGLGRDAVAFLEDIPGVRSVQRKRTGEARLIVDDASSLIPVLVNAISEKGGSIEFIEEYRPNFDEVFVLLVQQTGKVEGEVVEQATAAPQIFHEQES